MKYPLGIQSFSNLIEDGYIYIDKTALLYQLIEQGKWFFLSRPRRFGKSLLLSTFEALFEGKKELFASLAISNTDYAFEKHPILKFEFSQTEIKNGTDFREYVAKVTEKVASEYDIKLTAERYDFKLIDLVRLLAQKQKASVVLLVDEYDKPILNTLESPELAEVKSAMNSFYAAIKSLDEYLKFVMITGVSKFAKVSVFSGMNNLNDISTDAAYATICGYTKQEMGKYFDRSVEQLASKEGVSKEETYNKISNWYNGYTFSEGAEGIYNPFSILSLFVKEKFQNYWFQTATPTFLIERLKAKQYPLSQLENLRVAPEGFDASEPENTSIQALFVQTGYLTIKSWNGALYHLDFPNKEVKDSFYGAILEQYAYVEKGIGPVYIDDLKVALQNDDLGKVFQVLQLFFTNIPYDIAIQREKYYQSLFYAVFKMLGFVIETEVTTNKGRIDAVIQTSNTIYIFEFKLNGTKEQALKQIKDMQYHQKYLGAGKEIRIVGVEFDEQERNIGGWVDERV